MISRIYTFLLNLRPNNKIRLGKGSCLCFPVFVQGNVTIGKETYINSFSHLRSGKNSKIQIGNLCAISNNVQIRAKTHDILNPTGKGRKIIEKDIIIGDNVWIAANVVIREGIKIGNHTVIGANSVVSKDVPDFAIVGGVPAKIIRFKNQD